MRASLLLDLTIAQHSKVLSILVPFNLHGCIVRLSCECEFIELTAIAFEDVHATILTNRGDVLISRIPSEQHRTTTVMTLLDAEQLLLLDERTKEQATGDDERRVHSGVSTAHVKRRMSCARLHSSRPLTILESYGLVACVADCVVPTRRVNPARKDVLNRCEGCVDSTPSREDATLDRPMQKEDGVDNGTSGGERSSVFISLVALVVS
jgi:hypothetical protein